MKLSRDKNKISNPQVTIILPTYNRAQYLERAIKSVIDQTFMNWELIIWDDGSTDDTKAIVTSYPDKRIRYYSDQNHGVAFARNRASEKASSKFIAFLDSDDQWFPNKLSIQMTAMQENPDLDFLFTNFMNVNIQKKTEDIEFKQYSSVMDSLGIEERYNGIKIVKDRFLECLAKVNFIATDTVLLKRELLEKIGGFNETLRNSEDFELWWRTGLSGAQIGFLDDKLLIRNKPSESLSGPGLVAAQNTIKALDLCVERAVAAGREDLVPLLNANYRNAWQHLIIAHGTSSEKLKAINAFFQSTKYGFRPGSLKLLFKALLGIS